LATGFRAAIAAGYDVTIKMDADEQMDVDELPALVRPIELHMAEYTKGNRFRRTGRPASMPRRRWFGNVVLSFLTKVPAATGTCSTRSAASSPSPRRRLRRLKLDGMARDYFFENDMLIRLNVVDARVVDVDTSSLYGGETSYVNISRSAGRSPRGCCADSCGASSGAT